MGRKIPLSMQVAFDEARQLRNRLLSLEKSYIAAQNAFFSASNFRTLARGMLWGMIIGVVVEMFLLSVVFPILTRGQTLGPGGF